MKASPPIPQNESTWIYLFSNLQSCKENPMYPYILGLNSFFYLCRSCPHTNTCYGWGDRAIRSSSGSTRKKTWEAQEVIMVLVAWLGLIPLHAWYNISVEFQRAWSLPPLYIQSIYSFALKGSSVTSIALSGVLCDLFALSETKRKDTRHSHNSFIRLSSRDYLIPFILSGSSRRLF